MNNGYKTQKIGMVLLVVGSLFGLLLVAAITWADMEAFLFQFGLDADQSINTLKCPVVISLDEVGEISITLKNPDEDEMVRFVRAYVTDGYLTMTRQYKGQFYIEAGEKVRPAWEIFPEEAVYNRVILFRVYVHGHYPHPPMDGNCGVLVVDFLGLTGKQIFGLFSGLSLLGIVGGGYLSLWKALPESHPLFKIRNGLLALAVIFGLGLWVSLAGLWFLSALLLMASIFIIVTLVAPTFLHLRIPYPPNRPHP